VTIQTTPRPPAAPRPAIRAGPGPYFQGVAIQPRPGAQVAQETDRPMPTYAGIKHRGDDHDTTH
jgi:hypothetical protein